MLYNEAENVCHSMQKRKITAITEARSCKVIQLASDRKAVCYFLFVVSKSLRDDVTSTVSVSSFRWHLKTYLFDTVTRVSNTRDGPKFGRRRSSAEEFGRMFGSVRLGNM